MRAQTTATLLQLEEANWFSAIGATDSRAVIAVASWDEAIRHCSSIDWGNLCLEAANQFRARVGEKAPERLAQWNEVARTVKRHSVPLVKRKIVEVVISNSLPQSFEDSVQWDILNVCMEAEYADIYPPGFYASQAYWYVKGHFPCGWKGDFPKGALVIY